MLLSVIVPCYNEEGNIALFYSETVKALGGLMKDTELIFINDGSADRTLEELHKIYDSSPYHIQVVSFSRNFGKEAGLKAGLDHAKGEFTVIIDADLQQRPDYILDMMKILREHPEYDGVACYQEKRKENFLMTFLKGSFSKGIFAWVGFNWFYMPYEVEDRAAGTSKWNFWKLMGYALDGIIAFSNKPLIISSVLGVVIFMLSIVYMVVIIVKTLIWGDPVAGFPTLCCLLLMLSGIQLLCFGIMGQYMAKNYTETKGRPMYVVKEKLEK